MKDNTDNFKLIRQSLDDVSRKVSDVRLALSPADCYKNNIMVSDPNVLVDNDKLLADVSVAVEDLRAKINMLASEQRVLQKTLSTEQLRLRELKASFECYLGKQFLAALGKGKWKKFRIPYAVVKMLVSILQFKKLNSQPAPKPVINTEKASGEVRVGGITYFTDSYITSERVHTSAGNQKNTPLKNEVLKTSSEAVKKELLRCTANFLSLPVKELSFRKNLYGVPCISYDNRKIFDQFSFSDHGRFAAFSLSLRYS